MDAEQTCADYATRLQGVLATADWSAVGRLTGALFDCWQADRQVFLCGNGGSAGNAVHLANDLLYGVAKRPGGGLRATALPANTAVLTCLANDTDYEQIFALQLEVLGRPGDLLVVLSGSGNSPNILAALRTAKRLGMRSFAILGYAGGEAKTLADEPVHFAIDDMQISEDLQLIVGHMAMQHLYARRDEVPADGHG